MRNTRSTRRGSSAARSERCGFTLLECLVVIAIVGILAAILIPAVLSARRAANKTRCLNNLRQIGIGLSSYSTSFNSFPPANAQGSSMHVSILPFIDQKALYNSLNFRVDLLSSISNSTVISTSLTAFLCPSDSHYAVESGDYAWTNYAGNRGGGLQKYGENGAFKFPPGAIVTLGEFSDGMSTTVLVSEWILGGQSRDDRDPKKATFHTRLKLAKPEEFDQFTALCHNIDVATAKTDSHRKGLNWAHGELGKSLYNHTLSPNDHTCLNGTGYQIGAWTAGSRHPGGLNVMFADSSTRFVRETVDLAVWRAIGSRNGGEVVSQGSF